MQTQANTTHWVSIGVNFGLYVACIFPTWIIISELEKSHEVEVTEGQLEEDGMADADGDMKKAVISES